MAGRTPDSHCSHRPEWRADNADLYNPSKTVPIPLDIEANTCTAAPAGRVKEMQLFPTKITEADKEDKSAAKKGKPKAAAKPRPGGKKGGGAAPGALPLVRKPVRTLTSRAGLSSVRA